MLFRSGWVTGMGSLSGGSTFVSREYSITWGQAWDVEVGLLAWAYGSADSSFLGSARLTGFELFDAQHAPVATFDISALSGTDYINAVPEPQTWAMLLAGLVCVGGVARRRRPGAIAGRAWPTVRG